MPRLDIDADTWARLSALLDVALDVLPEARGDWLATLGEEPAIKRRLADLLSHAASVETSDFLASLPPLEGFAEAPAPTIVSEGALVGPYRLIRELGSGGMGSVWLAERADGLINRPVALKFPRGVWVFSGLRERMTRERDILATLEHPGIARLYDAGLTPAGDPYLALEYVEGRPLDEYCSAAGLGVVARLDLFLQAADAVAYAHSKLIIHRDLKPANMLVMEDGQLRLLDFGIGKLLDDQKQRGGAPSEVAGQALTPDYASPEQIGGRPLTVATDVYSLGVVLYELLTGQRPYRLKRQSRGALEDAILATEPARPSAAVSDPARRKLIRGDLDAIVQKALRKEAQARYSTMHAFADDVRRYLGGHAVTARPDSYLYRTRKLLMRHKLAAGTTALAVAGVVAGAGLALWQADIARGEARRAEEVTYFIASIFEGIDPNLLGSERPRTAIEMLERAERRVASELADEPAVRLRLRTVIARSYLGLFEPQRARDLLTAALADAGAAEPTQQELRAAQQLMADALLRLTELDEADRYVALVLESMGRDMHDAAYVTAKITEANIEYARSQYDRASAVAEEALAAADEVENLDAAVQVELHSTLARATGMQRRAEDSLRHSQRAYELALEAFGTEHDHPRVLDSEQSYAASLIDVGRMDDALPHLQRSLQAARTTYGEESLIAARFAVRLGLVFMERGELDSAIDLIANANRIEAQFEGNTAAKAGRQRTLGRTYIAARRMADAAREIDAAIETMREVTTPFIMNVLAADRAFVRAAAFGTFDESIAELTRVIAAQDEGEARYKTHLPDIYLGTVYLWNDNPLAALEHLERGVELARNQTRQSDLGEALSTLGIARLENGDVGGAGAALHEGLDLLQGVHLVATPARAEAALGLGRVALASGTPQFALESFLEAEQFWITFDPESRGAGEAAFRLGEAQSALGLSVDAGASFERAARLLAESPIPSDAALARRARDR